MTKKQEAAERANLIRELENLNASGREFVLNFGEPVVLCETPHPMELAYKLAKKFPNVEFMIVVSGDTAQSCYQIRMKPFWVDGTQDAWADPDVPVERARASVKRTSTRFEQLRGLPQTIEPMKLYAQGVSDALNETEKLRKELDELRSPPRGFHPAMMIGNPFLRYV